MTKQRSRSLRRTIHSFTVVAYLAACAEVGLGVRPTREVNPEPMPKDSDEGRPLKWVNGNKGD